MKLKFKGFTLIECLVALAVLGIASLIMAQIYANVSRINRSNHITNTSLAYQMKYVENYSTDADDTVSMLYGGAAGAASADPSKPPAKTSTETNDNYMSIQLKGTSLGGLTQSAGYTYLNNTYSLETDMYVLLSRDSSDKSSSDAAYNGEDEDSYLLRYKYLQPHQ